MAWHVPYLRYLHAARDAGADAITLSHTADTSYPKDYLIDDRAGQLFKFGTSGSSRYIDVDRGSGSLDAIDNLIIPDGHNLSGTIDLDADDTSGFTTPTSLLSGQAVSSGLIDVDFTSNSERYVRITFNASGKWEIPELIYTAVASTTRGPEPGWEDYLIHNVLEFESESGSGGALSLGADRRRFRFTYRNVRDSADIAVFDALVATCGRALPFWIEPPWETTPVWVRLTEDLKQQQERLAPASAESARLLIELSALEHVA